MNILNLLQDDHLCAGFTSFGFAILPQNKHILFLKIRKSISLVLIFFKWVALVSPPQRVKIGDSRFGMIKPLPHSQH